LEIGCAEGEFSQHLTKAREIWGCEPDAAPARAASARLTKVLVGKYEDVSNEIPDAYFDLVVCNDVIEHMQDHDFFFGSIQEKMVDNGFLVASIPNIRHIRALYSLVIKKDWRYCDSGTFDRTHLRWFTKKSLLRTLAEHRLDIEVCAGINGTSSPVKLAVFRIFNLLTFGYHSDIQYLQFGFRATKRLPRKTC
jgi:2-polyprenyl-3-methyl-5-hydroxy-6-metoxy-1,4-benzoquinol methylase